MASSSSTMAKLLLQNKPPQNQLSMTSSASLRDSLLVASQKCQKTANSVVTITPKSVATSSTVDSNNYSIAATSSVPSAPYNYEDPPPSPPTTTISLSKVTATAPPAATQQPVMIRFSEQQLAELSLKELNHYLRGLSKEEAAQVKRMRRAAKNKSYAVVQREKRQDDMQKLSVRKSALAEEISAVKFRKERVNEELHRVKKETKSLLALAKRLKIPVPAHVYELRSTSANAAGTSSDDKK